MPDMGITCQDTKIAPSTMFSHGCSQKDPPPVHFNNWRYPALPVHEPHEHSTALMNSYVNFQTSTHEQVSHTRHHVYPHKHQHHQQAWQYGVGASYIGSERGRQGGSCEGWSQDGSMTDHTQVHTQSPYVASCQAQSPYVTSCPTQSPYVASCQALNPYAAACQAPRDEGRLGYNTRDHCYPETDIRPRFERPYPTNTPSNDKLQGKGLGLTHQDNVPLTIPFDWIKPLDALGESDKTRTRDKYRVVYTDQQRLELEKEFYSSKYITTRRKAEIAFMLGLSERQVKIWFQNRRAKERRQKTKTEDKDTVQEQTFKSSNKSHEYKTYLQISSNQKSRDNVFTPKCELKNDSDLSVNSTMPIRAELTSQQGLPTFYNNLQPFDNSPIMVPSITSSDPAYSAVGTFYDGVR